MLHEIHRVLQGRGCPQNHDRYFGVLLGGARKDRLNSGRRWSLAGDDGDKRPAIEGRQGFALRGGDFDLETGQRKLSRQAGFGWQADHQAGFSLPKAAQLGHGRSMPNRHTLGNSGLSYCRNRRRLHERG